MFVLRCVFFTVKTKAEARAVKTQKYAWRKYRERTKEGIKNPGRDERFSSTPKPPDRHPASYSVGARDLSQS